MKTKTTHIIFYLSIVCISFFLSGCQSNSSVEEETNQPSISLEVEYEPEATSSTIHFLDTGNSDCILIENDGKYAMIDTGNTDDDAKIADYLTQLGIKQLDYLILTHWHADHIGASDTMISQFDVKTTLVPNGDADTNVYRSFITALSNKGLNASVPLEGATFNLGNGTLTIYNTTGGSTNENNNSLVVLYENGSDRALFMGDAETEVEANLSIGEVDLLKVGHHGSNTSSSERFLDQIKPTYAVMTVGQPNQYGHPHQEILARFENRDIQVYRTDEAGTIIFTSTGNGFTTTANVGSSIGGTLSTSSNNETNASESETSNSSTTPSSSENNSSSTVKDDNPDGIYNETSSEPKESFKNCTLLREKYPDGVPEGHPAYESKHDRDKDGWACEN